MSLFLPKALNSSVNITHPKAQDGCHTQPERTQTTRDAGYSSRDRNMQRDLIYLHKYWAGTAGPGVFLVILICRVILGPGFIGYMGTRNVLSVYYLYFRVCSTLYQEELQFSAFNVGQVTSSSVISLASLGTWSMNLIGSKLYWVRQPDKQRGKNWS